MKKRKGFNFYESYYQVVRELDDDKDKLDFLMALLSRQFEGIEPTNLSKMASFAYKSQQHSIDKQVEGFESKMETKLTPYEDPSVGSYEGGSEGSYEPPTEGSYQPPSRMVVMTTEGPRKGPREQEKEKEKEKAQFQEIDIFEEYMKNKKVLV